MQLALQQFVSLSRSHRHLYEFPGRHRADFRKGRGLDQSQLRQRNERLCALEWSGSEKSIQLDGKSGDDARCCDSSRNDFDIRCFAVWPVDHDASLCRINDPVFAHA